VVEMLRIGMVGRRLGDENMAKSWYCEACLAAGENNQCSTKMNIRTYGTNYLKKRIAPSLCLTKNM